MAAATQQQAVVLDATARQLAELQDVTLALRAASARFRQERAA